MNRSLLIGAAFRIKKVYGVSALGVRVMCAWHRALGERSILEKVLPRAAVLPPFANVNGEAVMLTHNRIARIRRKLAQVRLRGSTYTEGCLTRRQAA